jgi:fucose 4-O-acetylase-like acetyltransferase
MTARATGRARLDWVDALKGIGIIAVVAGHVWTRGAVRDAIYTVHMPLFFILSGYTARHVPWRQFVPRLSHTLLVPFVCFSILLLGADFLIESVRGMRPIFGSWLSGGAAILFATDKLRGPFTILWFIPCLFLARLAWNALAKSGRNPDDRAVLLPMAIVFVLALVAQYHGGRSPFGVLAVPGALLLIWMGAMWRLWSRPQPSAVLAFAVLALATLIWLPPVNMKLGYLGWPGVSLIGAGAVTVVLALLLQHMPSLLIGRLAALGRASLVIMYVHVAFIHYLAPYMEKAVLFLVALVAAFGLDWLIRRAKLTRILLLGEARAANPVR